MNQQRLSRSALRRLAPSVAVPDYDPASGNAGHRPSRRGRISSGHMARFTHDLMNTQPVSREWGIVGAGLLPGDRRMHDALTAQDGLYTLVERSGFEETVTVIGAIAGLVHSSEDSSALLEAIDRPPIRIVSLTVTENGYCLNPATKTLDIGHPAIANDLATPHRPHSAIGIIVEALRRRMDSGSERVHGAQLRQHPTQRQRAAAGGTRVRRPARRLARALDRSARSLSEHDGRSHHARDTRGRCRVNSRPDTA